MSEKHSASPQSTQNSPAITPQENQYLRWKAEEIKHWRRSKARFVPENIKQLAMQFFGHTAPFRRWWKWTTDRYYSLLMVIRVLIIVDIWVAVATLWITWILTLVVSVVLVGALLLLAAFNWRYNTFCKLFNAEVLEGNVEHNFDKLLGHYIARNYGLANASDRQEWMQRGLVNDGLCKKATLKKKILKAAQDKYDRAWTNRLKRESRWYFSWYNGIIRWRLVKIARLWWRAAGTYAELVACEYLGTYPVQVKQQYEDLLVGARAAGEPAMAEHFAAQVQATEADIALFTQFQEECQAELAWAAERYKELASELDQVVAKRCKKRNRRYYAKSLARLDDDAKMLREIVEMDKV